jgi:hypothetical protein
MVDPICFFNWAWVGLAYLVIGGLGGCMRHEGGVRLRLVESADLDLTLACVPWDGQDVIMSRVVCPSRGECPPKTT